MYYITMIYDNAYYTHILHNDTQQYILHVYVMMWHNILINIIYFIYYINDISYMLLLINKQIHICYCLMFNYIMPVFA